MIDEEVIEAIRDLGGEAYRIDIAMQIESKRPWYKRWFVYPQVMRTLDRLLDAGKVSKCRVSGRRALYIWKLTDG